MSARPASARTDTRNVDGRPIASVRRRGGANNTHNRRSTVPDVGTRRVWLLALVVGVVAVGCSDGSGAGARRSVNTDTVSDDPPTDAQPFRVDHVPSHFTDWSAGPGTSSQMWGWDCCGSHEPFTVLAPRGKDDVGESDLVVVAATSLDGERDIDRAQSPRMGGSDDKPFRVGKRDATHTAKGEWSEIVVDAGDGIGVRVSSDGLSRDDLVRIYRKVTPKGKTDAPLVEPAGNLDVVGKVSADLVVAVYSGPVDNEVPPGPASALSALWRASDEDYLSVMSLPGDAADLDALAGWSLVAHGDANQIEIAGRPAVSLHGVTLISRAPWGGIVVVSGRGGWVTEAELSRITDSIEATDLATWERFLGGPNGGPLLRADPGRFEIARGETEGVEWVLQGGPADEVGRDSGVKQGNAADYCLKLLLHRVCARYNLGSTLHVSPSERRFGESPTNIPGFAIVTTEVDADSVRVVTPIGDVGEAALRQLPGEPVRRAGVAFARGVTDHLFCAEQPGRDRVTTRVELLKGGQVVGCVGSS